jgi:hypothetical protein
VIPERHVISLGASGGRPTAVLRLMFLTAGMTAGIPGKGHSGNGVTMFHISEHHCI